ncbi:ABC transporter ATP-binding protein [Amaricoccus sp.]|uniref:ABC transporter ATP-binding protein n=1 Tax=Amaricoccus sp. TaxID=1872485 RepID=UPI001B68B83B|nr:ABC transporter ATP-binding protein [Amaricoccus sp.]MBP7002773.1 ABC transporter ATP-binding protein [Amaricoccus sp.]
MGVMLRVEDLAFAFPDQGRRLEQIGFELACGDVLCVLGPNGAGKTTLLRCLFGNLTPSAGAITIDGAAVGALSARELARKVAYVPQSSQSVFGHLVLDMVLMGRSAHLPMFETPATGDVAVAEQALERVGIGHLAGRQFATVSGGERQLCLLARALAQEAPVLILDEPAASLDFGNQIRILDIVAELAGSGYAVLMTTHHPDHALLVGSRVLALKEGRVFGSGAPDLLLSADFLSGLYDAPVRIIRDRDGTPACIPALASRSMEPRPCLSAS